MERTCLGCSRKRGKKDLVRLVTREGRLVADLRQALSGRGAYICPRRACLEEACKKRGAFARAFRARVAAPEREDLWRQIEGKEKS